LQKIPVWINDSKLINQVFRILSKKKENRRCQRDRSELSWPRRHHRMKNSANHLTIGWKIPTQWVSIGLWIDSSPNLGGIIAYMGVEVHVEDRVQFDSIPFEKF